MLSRLAPLLSVSTLGVLLFTGVAAAAPASAATSRDCKGQSLCLYDSANYRGAFKKIDCDSWGSGKKSGVQTRVSGFENRATSVINKCRQPVKLTGRSLEDKSYYKSLVSTTLKPGKWTNLGGKRKMDNRTEWVAIG